MTSRRNKTNAESKSVKIYVGPNSKTIQRFTVFKEKLPAYVENEIKACPALKSLFVPVETINEVQKRLSDKTSAESILFEEAKKHFEGVKS